MAPTIFLHVGYNKTGTTAIQRYFSDNREQLKKYGLLYPVTASGGGAHHKLSTALGFSLKNGGNKVDYKQLQDLYSNFQAELAQSSPDTILFSSENFSRNRPIAPIREFFKGYDVKIVVFVRRHDYWWASVYGQAVKMVANPPWDKGIENFIEFERSRSIVLNKFAEQVDRWADVFGQENVIVRPYEDAQNQPNIATDMLRTLDYHCIDDVIPADLKLVNRSLPPALLDVIDTYQRESMDGSVRNRLISHAISLAVNKEVEFIMHPVRRRELIEENDADYEYLARHYLARPDGRLFFERLPVHGDQSRRHGSLGLVRRIRLTAKRFMVLRRTFK